MPRGAGAGRRCGRRAARDAIRAGAGENGYNMVVLMVLVTVLSVLVAAALPAWSTVIQREKEEELIFRGLQYAEAIRVFQSRFGRLPNRLEELIEVEPRSIRRLWVDPMTGEARWGLIFAGAGEPIPGQQGSGGAVQGRIVGGDIEAAPPITNDPNQLTQGPISGVYSLAPGESLIAFDGKQTYREWHFTLDLLKQVTGSRVVGIVPGGTVDAGGRFSAGRNDGTPPDFSSRWIGRPWPRELDDRMRQQNLQQGGMPGQPGVAPGGAGQSPTGLPTRVPGGPGEG